MRTASYVASASALGLALAAPLEKRQAAGALTDPDILNFALTLEHLEATFYAQGLANFSASDFPSAQVYANIQQISADEASHVQFLTSALSAAGASPFQACTYDFSSVTSATAMLATAQVLEGVGVSAYLGAAGSINNTDYLTAAGSILTVEARHNAYIRYSNGYSPFPAPYETPLSPNEVVTLAAPFLASCPSGSQLTLTGFPAIKVNTTAPAVGSPVALSVTNTSAIPSGSTVYCGIISGVGAPAFTTYANGQCDIPANTTAGQVYIVLSSSNTGIADGTTLAGPAVVELGTKNETATAGSSNSSSGGSSGGSSSGGSSSGSSTSGGLPRFTSQVGAVGLSLALGLVAALAM
ncbi:uncharacterized protein L969DRAFT_15615 [Mixia osmundae IAM 14324]|uniref:Ferritin-like domain-containing protein n=1 Tax=Mixia osmundae (strain CBS 9802 / IAM 14324 / JCM 22182 / KY 12970) TaxID=764103 RepID=G7DYN1_MIXOS|nr:uncharacterized protein L969DRAFT_15615 [Mixia osmundae IAM 14324]KEI41590.1 hypothetical protein L969DRAFT_15615 [Mixia osmundae IAM 14324]GAA95691.1 hypothetical protein E5Q_02348 [Mixia osmundae IAM 14324]